MPGVTISAGYGAGGSVVARSLADRLGYPLLDRAISSRIAEELHVSVPEAEGGTARRSLVERFFDTLVPTSVAVIGSWVEDDPPPADDAAQFRERAEQIMRTALPRGAVILGRAGAAALRNEPGVLRVRLFGPTAARIDQAARIEDVDIETAGRLLPEVDRARSQYVRRLYHCDIDDPALYHLQIDSTALPLERCVDVIAAAYDALPRG
jgi:cytidylate kinase